MKNVLEFLEHSAEMYPDKEGVTDKKNSCSYKVMKEASCRIGSALAKRNVRTKPVAVLMDKDAYTIFSLLGIVYAGGFYVVLNPDLPMERLKKMQHVLNADYVITNRRHAETAQEFFSDDAILLVEDLITEEMNFAVLHDIRSQMIDTDPLYINFTSGSTGVPKGVLVSHRSVIDFISEFTNLFDVTRQDRIGNQAPLDFDVSVKDIYSSLKSSGTLVLIPKELFSKPTALLDYLCEKEVTTLIWAVSALCLVTTVHGLDYRVPEKIRKIFFSGEVMPVKHLKTWMRHLPQTVFINLYGPTEITCNCTYHILERGRSYADGIPIGRPFWNDDVFLLDENDKRITEPFVTGEICIRGTSLALGYYRDFEQTEKVFVPNPINQNYLEYIYRSGDLGSYSKEGELFFKGRKDYQIKYQGHRIELEEIERTIANTTGVERCCCIFEEEKQQLFGFYTGEIDHLELRRQLENQLPRYMIPRRMYQESDFPLNKNGKIDRKKMLEGTRLHAR